MLTCSHLQIENAWNPVPTCQILQQNKFYEGSWVKVEKLQCCISNCINEITFLTNHYTVVICMCVHS